MAVGSLELTARVGAGGSAQSHGSPSIVTLADTTITAGGGKAGGNSTNNYAGGAGYSGGGGYSQSSGVNGGTNGGDGGDGGYYSGGSGTGEDITAYELTHFTLSPGQGGQARPGES